MRITLELSAPKSARSFSPMEAQPKRSQSLVSELSAEITLVSSLFGVNCLMFAMQSTIRS